MSIPYVTDSVTEMDSALFNPWIDRLNGLADGTVPIAPLESLRAGIYNVRDYGAVGDGAADDTGAGDSNWMYGVNDNSGTGTWASTGIAYATGTVYRLGIHVDPSSGDIQFLISTGSNADSWSLVGTVASGAANTPGTTAALTRYARVTTLTNAARHINLSRITHYHER